ncbi:PH domain-containing protein [Eupransor demetentiae]|uniref:Contains bPH2 (Bacterial pleckstrin homology) domain (YdbT) n=1 Tax=Eupransor demetentiae TaxID=3109584 RepID=A0ABM9N472_9LACO|nr:Uncharacterized membrane protein YdbT [Lactobacillaceae bacterium LMG 33000]
MPSNQGPKHFNFLAVIFDLAKAWYSIVLSIVFISSKEHGFTFYLGFVLLAFIIGSTIWSYCFTTYEIGEKEVILRRGFFFKTMHHLPYQRIQNVDRKQWFFLKPFHVEQVTVDSGASNAQKEAVDLAAVNDQVADIIEEKRRLSLGGDSTPAEDQSAVEYRAEDDPNQHRVTTGELVEYAVTDFRVVSQLFILWAFLNHVPSIGKVFEWLGAQASLGYARYGMIVFILLALLVIILILGANVLRIVFMLYGFTLKQDGEKFEISKGLLQTSRLHFDKNRIQAVKIQQNIFRKIFHLVTVQVDLIAGKGVEDSDKAVTLFPVLKENETYDVLHKFINFIPEKGIAFQPAKKRTYWFLARNAFVLMLLPIAMAAYFCYSQIWFWPLAAMLLILAIAMGLYKARHTGAQVFAGEYLALQNAHFFRRSITYAGWHEIQSINLRQSIFMAKAGYAHFVIAVRNGESVNYVECRYLPIKQAEGLYQWYREFPNQK